MNLLGRVSLAVVEKAFKDEDDYLWEKTVEGAHKITISLLNISLLNHSVVFIHILKVSRDDNDNKTR